MVDYAVSDTSNIYADDLAVSIDEYFVFYKSTFDVSGKFALTVPQIVASAQPLSVKTHIRLAISFQLVANNLSANIPVHIGVKPAFETVSDNLEYDIGRGDLRVDFACYAPSLLAKALPLVPNEKTVEFGEFVFTYAKRESPDQITPEIDDRFARYGVSEPKIYTRKINIIAESNDISEYYKLHELYGVRRSLSVYGFAFPDAYISNLSDLQKKAGLARWGWHVEFTHHKFESVDTVIIDGWSVPTVISVSDEQKQPILSDGYAERGISEPIGFSVTRSIQFIDYHGECGSQLENRIGKPLSVTINGESAGNYKITNVSSSAPKGGGLIKIFNVDLQRYQFNTDDSVSFGNVTLSNPMFPNAHDITPEYSVDMGAGFGSLNPIPVISRRFAVECICESVTEFNNLVSAIGTKQTLIINGVSHTLCYISSLSALQPRGGGNIWKYTIEFSRKSGDNPVVAKFNNITLPNAVLSSEDELEILQTRTTLHNGKIAVDLGATPSRRFSITCMANDKTGYNQLYALIGQKNSLIIDGETIPKAYISSWGTARKIGTGTTRLYVYTIGFEEETA